MSNFFKTTLVAAAIAGMSSVANAGDTSVKEQIHSLQGLIGVTAAQTSEPISYETKAAYAVGDKVTFTFTTGLLPTAQTFPPQLNVAAISGRAGMALGLLDSTATSVTYRVTSVNQHGTETGKTTLGSTIALGTVSMAAAAVAAGTTTVTVASITSSGDALDSGSSAGKSRTGVLTQVKSQYGVVKVATAAGFDGVVDVAASRKALTTTNDMVTFTVSSPATTGWLNLATTNKTSMTLSADLAGFDLTKGVGSVATGSTSTVTYDDTKKEVSIAYGTSVEITTDTITIAPPVNANAVVLSAQDFTLAGQYAYSSAAATAGVASLGTAAAGEWTLNGAVVNVPYMPYSPSISQILYVTNAGSLTADISVTAFDDAGTSYDLGVIAQANKKSVTKIARQVKDGLNAAGFTSGKVSLTITVNAQDKEITVYSAYNVGSDRGMVNNSQYKK